MQNYWFTSDTHYHHKNIIKYSNRPFKTVEEMNEKLIENFNSVVKPNDLVYHLGDFGFCTAEEADKILTRLNGKKFFIFGNHDSVLEKSPVLKKHFIWARNLTEIKVGDTKVVLCHYAMRVWNRSHYGSVQLYGHSHGTLPDDTTARSMDVGVDPNAFFPINWDTVQAHMAMKKYAPSDHHGTHEEKANNPEVSCVKCGKPTYHSDRTCDACL